MNEDRTPVWCACGTHMISVWRDEDVGGIELCFWRQGDDTRSWRNRLRGAWAWLRGRPYPDMVYLDDAETAALVDALKGGS